ncbi:MAG: hypothetical protein GVY08_03330 [Bacteroidetes bacterium]|nr:hypothetical protein [Bacteroidota bacterium]
MRLLIHASDVDQGGSVIQVNLNDFEDLPKAPVFVNSLTGTALHFQPHPEEEGIFLGYLKASIPTGESQTFYLSQNQPLKAAKMTLEDDGNGVILQASGQPLLRYNYRPFPGKPWEESGKPPAARLRSGNIHPVWSPSGQELTEIFPESLSHHLGLWGAWVKTRYKDQRFDFWNLKEADATESISFRNWIWQVTSGPVMAGFKTAHVWALDLPDGRERVMEEILEVMGYPGPGGVLFDYVVEQTWVADSPLELLKHTYGGTLAWRYPSDWIETRHLAAAVEDSKQGVLTGPAVDAAHARWFRVEGARDGRAAGFLVMSHPENFRHPESVRMRHDGPGQGGYIHFTPIRETSATLETAVKRTFRYRVFVYDQTLSPAEAESLWQQYANPPQIELLIHEK